MKLVDTLSKNRVIGPFLLGFYETATVMSRDVSDTEDNHNPFSREGTMGEAKANADRGERIGFKDSFSFLVHDFGGGCGLLGIPINVCYCLIRKYNSRRNGQG